MEPKWPSQNTGDTRLVVRMMLQAGQKIFTKNKTFRRRLCFDRSKRNLITELNLD
jgi:hypothetical protein